MSEKRKPDAVLYLTTAEGKKCRYEIFHGAQFADRMAKVPFCYAEQPNLQIHPVDLQTQRLVRVRVDGKWLPVGRRALFPLSRVSFLIGQHLQHLLVQPEVE